jgi:5'-methylthioadenosine phosphorylase
MGRLALIAGSSLRGEELPSGDWEVLQRHGEATSYVLPHQIEHVANLRSLAAAGCDRVLAVGSVGGLRPELVPGTLVCPDDFVALDAQPLSAGEGAESHRIAGFDPEWRAEVIAAFGAAEVDLGDGGVYWQSTGPRLETPAEVRLLAEHADLVGMTIGSECVAASELGVRYAAVCMVDNLANGVGGAQLTVAELEARRAANRDRLEAALAAVLPALA